MLLDHVGIPSKQYDYQWTLRTEACFTLFLCNVFSTLQSYHLTVYIRFGITNGNSIPNSTLCLIRFFVSNPYFIVFYFSAASVPQNTSFLRHRELCVHPLAPTHAHLRLVSSANPFMLLFLLSMKVHSPPLSLYSSSFCLHVHLRIPLSLRNAIYRFFQSTSFCTSVPFLVLQISQFFLFRRRILTRRTHLYQKQYYLLECGAMQSHDVSPRSVLK
jgi:hypothetical protein